MNGPKTILALRKLTDTEIREQLCLLRSTLQAMRNHPFPVVDYANFARLAHRLSSLEKELQHWSRARG